MGILNAAAANAAKRALEKALPDRCAITRVGPTADGSGGWTEGETAFATGIPCRVDLRELSPRERAVGGRPTAIAAYTISLSTVASRWPAGTVDVRATDRLVVTGEASGVYEPADPGGPVSDELLRAVPANRVS